MSHFWSSRVRFNDNVTRFEYEDLPNSDLSLYDRAREEPRHIWYLIRMASVQDLLENVCRRRSTTVVYGNLGIYPKLLSYYLDLSFKNEHHISIRVGGKAANVNDSIYEREKVERWWENLIKDYYFDDNVSKCDVLFWIEPDFDAYVQRPHRASRMIVLTSHLLLGGIDSEETFVTAHHVGSTTKVPPLAKYVTMPEKDEDASFEPDPFFVRSFKVLNECNEWDSNCWKVCADLRGCRNPKEAYLKLLNARDAIKYSSRVLSLKCWTVAIDNDDLLTSLTKNLYKMKEVVSTIYNRIPCNLFGMNMMIDEYLNPFLINVNK